MLTFPPWFLGLAARIMPAPAPPDRALTDTPPAPRRSRALPAWLYALAKQGQSLVAKFTDCDPHTHGTFRAKQLSDLIMKYAALPSVAARKPTGPYARRYHSRHALFSVPGFCYAKLFSDEWVVPAICALGPYPLAADVARLSAYFSSHASGNNFGIFTTSSTRGHSVVSHVHGAPRRVRYSPQFRLFALGASRVGASSSSKRVHWPALGKQGPSTSTAPITLAPPKPAIAKHLASIAEEPTAPANSKDKGKGKKKRVVVQMGLPAPHSKPKARKRDASPAPYTSSMPYNRQSRPRRSPPAEEPVWMSATRDGYDTLLLNLRDSLKEFSRDVATPVWEEFSVWLRKYKDDLGDKFSRVTSLPMIQAHFDTLQARALAEVAEAAKKEKDLAEASRALGDLLMVIADLDKQFRDPTSTRSKVEIVEARHEARASAREMEAIIKKLSPEEPPPTEMADEAANNSSFVPVNDAPAVQVRPWEEGNNHNFLARTSELFTQPSGKIPLDDLAFQMEAPVTSKLLMPRALELYSVEELKKATARGARVWLNRYEDPCEPVKPWSWETMSEIYNKPGFRFLLARVAQIGPQLQDRKLATLRAKLSERWGLSVTFETIDPRLDWMLGTVPDIEGPAKEILNTALIRLYDGNASYVVRHFGPITRYRELDVEVKGTFNAPDQVYNRLKKRILRLEAAGDSVGFRVISVRTGDASRKYRMSFILDKPTTCWDWSHKWGHPHGAPPVVASLLNFEQPWRASKPWSCRLCYNSDHFGTECPLLCMKIGGVPVISQSSRDRVINRKHPEKLTATEENILAPSRRHAGHGLDDAPEEDDDDAPARPGPPAPPPRPRQDDDMEFSEPESDDSGPPRDAPPVPPAPDAPQDTAMPDDAQEADEDVEPEFYDKYEFFSQITDQLPAPHVPVDLARIIVDAEGDLAVIMRTIASHYGTNFPKWGRRSLAHDYDTFLISLAAREGTPDGIVVDSVGSHT